MNFFFKEDQEDQRYNHACDIWFSPAEDRTARELGEMPTEQREKVWADMSGNEDVTFFQKEIEEDPSKYAAALLEFEAEINRIKTKPAYEIAEKQSSYVHDQTLRLMFLRSCDYEAKEAATKLVKHMEAKMEVWGPEFLGRDVMLSDLTRDDMDCLGSGAMQFLSKEDSGGRIVGVADYAHMPKKDPDNLMRAFWYFMMSAAYDDRVQQNGIIIVNILMSDYQRYDFDGHMKLLRALMSIPFRIVARYIVFRNSLWSQVFDVLSHVLSRYLRVRSRTICGSYQECMYKLLCLGIPVQVMPSKENGEINLKNFKQWLEDRKKNEIELLGTRRLDYADGKRKKQRNLSPKRVF